MNRLRRLRPADVLLYRICDDASGWLICSMVVFSPWAFGTTEHWSIWMMNVAGYALGAMLAMKLSIRWFKGYQPSRWEHPSAKPNIITGGTQQADQKREAEAEESRSARQGLSRIDSPGITVVLMVLTLAILGYCLISATNARATYHPSELNFEYHDFYRWLPASLDSGRTWFALWSYLALACSFWAVRDWLLGKSAGEDRAEHKKAGSRGLVAAPLLPARLRGLLWLLALNGGLLGLEGILQRVVGSTRLLFLVQPHVNPEAKTQFGPFAYRANAGQYLNLLWPVVLAFWWTLQGSFGHRKGSYLLLVCSAIMASCPLISTSRGAAFITIGIVVSAFLMLLGFQLLTPRQNALKAGGLRPIALCLSAALFLGYLVGWKTLQPRMAQLQEGFAVREQMYAAAKPMAADYPVFGTGPGTFETVFQLYRISTETYWPAQLHNDWLETRITFGWVGTSLILLALLIALVRWCAPGGIHGSRRFMVLLWLALAGCMAHARYDFPFQIYSILFLFLVLCAIASVLSRKT